MIDKNVNPAVASHGGHVDLVGVDANKAIIALVVAVKVVEWLMSL